MKKSIILLTVLFMTFAVLTAHTPQWYWAIDAGGSNIESGRGISVDANGNSYITGFFLGTATFGDITITSIGEEDIFIAKIDASGNWQWVKQAGGSSNDLCRSISVDANGNSYVTGFFKETATFGSTILTSSGYHDIFFAKLNTEGNWQWAINAGGSNIDQGFSISVDANGNSYITGVFSGTATFGSTTLTSSDSYDIFVARLDTYGNWQWAKQAGGTNQDISKSISIDANGNSYITGIFLETAAFGTTNLNSNEYGDIFVAKIDAIGNWLWAKQAGGDGPDCGYGISVDTNGNSYVTGNFKVTATFGSSTITSNGSYDIFVARLDTYGNWQWATNAGDGFWDNGYGISVDSNGNSYVTGFFTGTATFGDITLTCNGWDDIFVAKLDPDGNWLWVKNAGGSDWDDSFGISIDVNGNSYITGSFEGTITFGDITLTSSGEKDIFVAKLAREQICDMMGMLSTDGYEINELLEFVPGTYPNHGGNDPVDYFFHSQSFFLYETTQNAHGYGIIYYNCYDNAIIELDYEDENTQVFRCEDSDDTGYDSPYYYAVIRIINHDYLEHHAVIVLAHNRQSIGINSNIPDPHPFIWDYELTSNPEMPCYSFEHSGTIDQSHISTLEGWIIGLFPTWLTDFVYKTSQIGTGGVVDSEVYFHWIMANIKACNGNILLGLHNAVKDISGWDDSEKNFIFSDGNALYAFRDYGESDPNDYYLCYYDGLDEDNNPFRAVRSDFDYSDYLTPIHKNELVYIPRKGNIIRYESFNKSEEISGIVSGIWTETGSPYYIVGDVTVEDELTIESGVEVFFLTKCDFNIYGQVYIEEDAEFNLSHASKVTIDGTGAKLFLDWGSIITGFTPTTYYWEPGHEEETAIPGDRISCKNGGRITTWTKNDYDNYPGTPPSIEISSSSGEIWDGIMIKNPVTGLNNEYWLVNCDISGIRKLSMEGDENGSDGNLYLYHTNFTECGQIVIRDGNKLTIHGDEGDLCYIQKNYPHPIYSYESPVDLSCVWIGGFEEDDGLENGGGIYLYDSARENSIINNCNFMYNNSDGVKINGVAFEEFNNNNIENNTGFGMLCYPGTVFEYQNFNDDTIRNNGFAEYAGWQSTFEMSYPNANITIEDGAYGSGSDQYLLMDILWDGETPVDISGTNITIDDLPHLFPSDTDAWTFGGDVFDERLMLYSASSDMSNGNYTTAEQTLQQIIVDYPLTHEAGIAVYYLYHLENLSAQDFADMRNYLENICADESTPLYSAVEKIITKSYMKDKDYLTAIDRLETIINNSQIPDEVISAMIDEGYCYVKLLEQEGGCKALPDNCTVRTETLDEYQAKVMELEKQFSFYPDEQEQNIPPEIQKVVLHRNYPNPFNPSTTISFDLPLESNVSITVYNIKGQKVKKLVDEHLSKGSHSATWNGTDSNNKSVSSGIYFFKLSSGAETKIRKMLLLK